MNGLGDKIRGKIISLFRKEPLVIAHSTGISREAIKPDAFSAFTARSSPRIPAVFLPATLLSVATSSINIEISSSKAKNPEAIVYKIKIWCKLKGNLICRSLPKEKIKLLKDGKVVLIMQIRRIAVA
jgi:hypothetical protein